MRLKEPRLAPLTEVELNEQQRELLDKAKVGASTANIFATLAHHPDLLRRWLRFGNHILFNSSLPGREREMVILRVGWLKRAGYEWGQHVQIGRREGLTEDEIKSIAKGPSDSRWNDAERALLEATDELCSDAHISDETWQALTKTLDEKQLLDLVFTVGQYNMVSMALNTLGVQLDEGVPTWEEAPGFAPEGL